jgi:hypothetical protein
MNMRILWIRLIIGAVVVETAAVIILVGLVAIFGPNEATAAQRYAEKLGFWVGPIAGTLLTFIGAFMIARPLLGRGVLHGFLFGFCVAFVDVAILLAMRAPFEWIFLVSNVSKLIAGYLGGVCAARSRATVIGGSKTNESNVA